MVGSDRRQTGGGIMKRHAIGIAAALALLGQQGMASAQGSANTVMLGCRNDLSQHDDKNQVYLSAMCTGIIRTMFYFGSRLGFCIPDGTNAGQAIRVVVLYIDQRPARMHERFEDLALEAMQKAWPCRRQ